MPPDPDSEAEAADLCRVIKDIDATELLALVDNEGLEGIALADTSSKQTSAAAFIQLLRRDAPLSELSRGGLIHLLRGIADAPSAPAAVRLIQGGLGPPEVGSHFPHLVARLPLSSGAFLPKGPLASAEDEACEWQQYKTKLTRITVQLRNQHGALCRCTRARMRAV